MLSSLVQWLVQTVGSLGYPGIVALMFLESSFFPFPSEVVMPPAGYLAAKGSLSLPLVILSGIFGSLLGALFNYWICATWGRRLFQRFGKYFLISPKVLDRSEQFFQEHGPVSTLIGRLIPGIRQIISLPAGVARMPLIPFMIYTTIGASIWVCLLTYAGYVIGNDAEAVHQKVIHLTALALGCAALGLVFYIWRHIKKKKQKTDR